MSQPVDGAARFFAWFAVALWVIVAVAIGAMTVGEEGAINPVVGVTPPAVLATVAAIVFRRQDQR
ncbi:MULTISPECIES: hypothetical protein [Streptomyces]|uniref:hypothetical protein n=1 Tax=Streptomyces TaxID=1883 RepID=UPI000F79D3BC|nr:hypothetical protein [Streptomyces sp. WAC05858]RSS45435.1 hypothetical protein EF902_14075 [Streptomyces sp. WAC05858]WTA79209.1 hypothetical protein OG751_04045 [Streptomyces antimycoticus]